MNARLLAAFLCLTVAGTGCIIVDHDNDGPCCNTPAPTYPGNVTFIWTFANAGAGRCADVPEVRKVRITIPGETLLNGGIYPCNTAGTDGIELHDFAPGNYSYTLEALSYTDQVLYKSTGTFTVNGNTRVNSNLTPNGSQSSYALVSWYFPANTSSSNPNCYQAGVTHVDVRVDGQGSWARIACEDGYGAKQVSSPYLSPGTHSIELVGVNVSSSGTATPYYYTSGTFTTQAGNPIAVSYTIDAVGGLAVRWELIDSSAGKTCSQAGVSQVAIQLYDIQRQQYVYPDPGDVQACGDAPIIYQLLRPGDYKVYIRSTGQSVSYSSDSTNPPTLRVTAFQQKTVNDAYTVYLYRR